MPEHFDYVIIGSGPAGSILANRLTVDEGVRVCVLEAGPPDTNRYVRVPAGFVKLLHDPAVLWDFATEPGDAIAGRSLRLPQGRIVGGSSSINGLAYSRGQAADFDDWAAAGNPGWASRDVLPYFMRSERRIGAADSRLRGRAGELPITDPDWPNALCEAFLRGAEASGIPRNADYNGERQEGAGYFQRTVEHGRRISCADAFLRPAIRRGRVDLRVRAHADRLLFDARRATGVRYRQQGETRDVFARREVLVCAGTLNSPCLLQRSGIGDASTLQALGVPVIVDSPGVGENLRDHYTVRIAARARNAETINELARGWRLGVEVAKWLVHRPSIIGLSPSLIHVFWKSDPSLTRGDLQVLFTPASYKTGRKYALEDFPGMSCGARQQRPFSAGHVRLRSADPDVPPNVQPNYLADSRDGPVVVAGLKLARSLLNTDAMRPFLDAELVPGAAVQTDDEWLDFARRNGSTAYHLVGTCRMGPDGDRFAVTDPQLRVRGTSRLRVVDASVMPQVPSANTQAATMMLAERAADLIRGRAAPDARDGDRNY
ncbi:MAG: GMC family oxidoreductase [Lautropia sp.]